MYGETDVMRRHVDRLREQVSRPLEGLRVGPFYGCYVLRPRHRLGYDEHPERDLYLDRLIEALGGEVSVAERAGHACGAVEGAHEERQLVRGQEDGDGGRALGASLVQGGVVGVHRRESPDR